MKNSKANQARLTTIDRREAVIRALLLDWFAGEEGQARKDALLAEQAKLRSEIEALVVAGVEIV